MKRLLFLIIIGCLAIQGISQIPKEIQDFDKSELSDRARSIIDTFESHRYHDYLHYYRLSDEKRNESFNNFHRFLTEEASLSDTKIFLNYPDNNYNRLAYYRLLDLGYTKIDLLKLLANDTEMVQPFYDCVVPLPNKPNWTKIGNYVHSFSKNYSEIEKDSIIEILFLMPNNLTRMKAHYLINLENNSKHLDWAIELGKREGFYSVAIPLIKYRFEEEKELILKLLKSWLFEAKEYSTFWNYLSSNFDKTFDKIKYDKGVVDLFYEYHKVEPNRFYASNVYKYITFQRDTTSLRVLRELYYREKQSKSKKHNSLHYYTGNLATYALRRGVKDTIYKDLYFEIWFDNGDYHDDLPISYIKKKKPHEFDKRIIQYFYEHKDSITKKVFPRDINHHIRYYIGTKRNKYKAKKVILDLIHSKNNFIKQTIISSIYDWTKANNSYDEDIVRELFTILVDGKVEKYKISAFLLIHRFNKQEDLSKLVSWYESDDNKLKAHKELKRIYVGLIREDKIEECLALIKKGNINKLMYELNNSDDMQVAKKVFWAIYKNEDKELFDVFSILMLKFNLWERETISFMYKTDTDKTNNLVLTYFERGLKRKKPTIHNGYSSLEPLIEIYIETETQNTIIKGIHKLLTSDDNGDISSALTLAKAYREKYNSYEQETSELLWKILGKYRLDDRYENCIYLLAMDKTEHEAIGKWYNERISNKNDYYRRNNRYQFERIENFLIEKNIIDVQIEKN